MPFRRIPSNQSKGIINPRLPNLLNIVFPIDIFHGFTQQTKTYRTAKVYLALPGFFFEGISQNRYLKKCKSFVEETDYVNSSLTSSFLL